MIVSFLYSNRLLNRKVTKCNLDHSREIIFNLIDIILDSNQIGLKLSEVEGDAVLFYLKGVAPKKEVLVQQAKRTFADFHNSLKAMGNSLFCGCKCGGCRTASNLTLKFIVHYGACKEVFYNGFTKLIDSDVIYLIIGNIVHATRADE